jgi:plastocyanin
VLGAVASNWEIVAIAGGVPATVLSLFLIAGGSRRLAAVWVATALVFAVVSGFGIYDAFIRPVPRASAAARSGPTQQPTLPSTPASSGPSCAPSGTTISLRAANVAFDATCLAAPANTPVTIDFDNADPNIAHNVHIFSANPATDPSARSLFLGALITGPATTTYDVPALASGTYFFHCDVHPTTMVGSYVVP